MTMTDSSSITQQAVAIMQQNDRGTYTVPTDGLYPYQWNWDSAFAALGFAHFDLNRGWIEIETLMSGQWDDGMVPHIIFHKQDPRYFPGPDVWGGTGPIASSGISQPPIAMSTVRWLYERDPVVGDARARAVFDGLMAWAEWFVKWRSDQGAICITHPWEAGRDNAPDWDIAMAKLDPVGVGSYERRDINHVDREMRPTQFDYDRYIWLVQQGSRLGWDQTKLKEVNSFRVADPTMTFTLLRGVKDLVALGQMLGLDVSRGQQIITDLTAGAATLWNAPKGHYDSRDTNSGRWSESLSNASFLCWYAGINSPEMETHLARVLVDAPFGVPSLAANDLRFDSKRYWRGPSWAIMNMMIGMGLSEAGSPLGEDVRQITRKLILDFGFAEYFDSLSGAPAGGKTFTWTAAVWLDWARDEGED